MIRSLALTVLGCLAISPLASQPIPGDPLACNFKGGYGQVEVGGPFVGAEFHHSRPVPSRISFFYPVANSIDLSTDYWQRDNSQPMMMAIQTDNGIRRLIGKEPWEYTLSPHKVQFEKQERGLHFSVKYESCLREPAMAFTFIIKNASSRRVTVNAYTHLRLSLRTCQTYARKDWAWTEFDSTNNSVMAHFDDADAQRATCFVQSVGAKPVQWTTSSDELAVADTGSSRWLTQSGPLRGLTMSSHKKGKPVAAFIYQKTIAPHDSLVIVQLIGSCNRNEAKPLLKRLAGVWQNEIEAYNAEVVRKSNAAMFVTGDAWLDRSAMWARAILTTNAHYLDGTVVPMPCPAEYNFFFTHDALMTDLAAVSFDAACVKRDLLNIAKHAKENIIPHAYYWRDDGFKTEYCTPDNWNHLWFILVSASYLRHSNDDSAASVLYPLITKSLEEILKQKKSDNLMYAFRPDWWDIGHVEGPRAYITILTIRALRDYLFINSALRKSMSPLVWYERLADSMQLALDSRLWDAEAKYLMNWNSGQKDEHYYMGSLLAPAFEVLSTEKAKALVATATEKLVDARIGVRCAMPADFHTKESIAFFKFAGDEAGQPYYYINGGVWPHNNAWYALALKNIGRVDDALHFVKTTMSIDGVAHSPMGVPAMYEYRFADSNAAEFGKIDKPSFLWAGGFYLYTLYQLFGLKENEWNISLAGPLPKMSGAATYSLSFGERKTITISGEGEYLQAFMMGGQRLPSLVLPLDAMSARECTVTFGKVTQPYLDKVNAVLHSVRYEGDRLSMRVSSFPDHQTRLRVISPGEVRKVILDGKKLTEPITSSIDNLYAIEFSFAGTDSVQTVEMEFEE